MRESCSSGSVGGEGGNRLAYPAISCQQTQGTGLRLKAGSVCLAAPCEFMLT